MQHRSFFYRAYDLYRDGFRHMTIGKMLWLIVLVKLFLIFVVLKIFLTSSIFQIQKIRA